MSLDREARRQEPEEEGGSQWPWVGGEWGLNMEELRIWLREAER